MVCGMPRPCRWHNDLHIAHSAHVRYAYGMAIILYYCSRIRATRICEVHFFFVQVCSGFFFMLQLLLL